MEINNDKGHTLAPGTSRQRPTQGSEMRAQVLDIRRDTMTIRTQNGTVLTGHIAPGSAGINASIGETAIFFVERGPNGEIILQVQEQPFVERRELMLREALVSMGLQLNSDNMRIAVALFENGLALTRENIQQMSQAARHSSHIEMALFFLENEIPATPQTAAVIEGLSQGGMRIGERIENIINTLRSLPDTQAAQHLANILIKGEAALTQRELALHLDEMVFSKLAMPLNNELKPEIISAFSNLHLEDSGAARLAELVLNRHPAYQAEIEEVFALRAHISEAIRAGSPQITQWLDYQLGNNSEGHFQNPAAFSRLEVYKVFESMLKEIIVANLSPNQGSYSLTYADISAAVQFAYPGDATAQALALGFLGLEDAHTHPKGDNIELLETRLSFSPEEGTHTDFKYLNLRENFELARQAISRYNLFSTTVASEQTASLLADISSVSDMLELGAQLRDSFYTQIPVLFGNTRTSAELFVFKDRRAARNTSSGSASALIALDTAFIGRFEAYVVKVGRSISLQFRLEREDVKVFVKANLEALSSALKAKGYNLEASSFKTIDDPFRVLHKEYMLGREEMPRSSEISGRGQGRTSFDIRV